MDGMPDLLCLAMSTTDKDGNMTTASMGGNTTITEADLGVPFYPGSTEKSSGQAKIETDKAKNVISVRLSGDLPAKVLEFYKSKVKGSSTSTFNTDGTDMGICSGNSRTGQNSRGPPRGKRTQKRRKYRSASEPKSRPAKLPGFILWSG